MVTWDEASNSNVNALYTAQRTYTYIDAPEGTLVTYAMLQRFGVDSVVFTKHGELNYSVDFAEIGTYEEFYGGEDTDDG